MIFCEPVHEQIVDDCSFGRRQRGILRLAVPQLCRIVRHQAIDEGNRIGTAHVYLAHMRDVEQTSMRARTQVLGNGSGRILYRHIPTAKFDHAPAEPAVRSIQRRSFQFKRRRVQSRAQTFLKKFLRTIRLLADFAT